MECSSNPARCPHDAGKDQDDERRDASFSLSLSIALLLHTIRFFLPLLQLYLIPANHRKIEKGLSVSGLFSISIFIYILSWRRVFRFGIWCPAWWICFELGCAVTGGLTEEQLYINPRIKTKRDTNEHWITPDEYHHHRRHRCAHHHR
ncbi:hypothetical protein BKA65DRAFT_199862 [Rhexocercosporidium sp. MPI-PUGE-AT-0058]|nr:hypothetical protein BKA65DRAFT_199862 [Rhexocercosporidium sp. MPI-PUGE-AT-0058]